MSEPIPWRLVRHLLDEGVPADMAPRMVSLRTLDDRLAFYEELDADLVLWQPRTGSLTTFAGRAFALGSANVTAGALDYLRIHASPLDWLRDRCRGLVIVHWEQTFERLRDVPRVAVAEAVLPQYRAAMRPPVPDLAVFSDTDGRAAA